MTSTGPKRTIREAVGVFDDAGQLEAAIDALEESGFDRAELSLLAGEHAVREKLGRVYEKVAELEDDPAAPRAAYVSKESVGAAEGALVGGLLYVGACVAGAVVASVGAPIAAVASAAALAGGAGGLIGAALSGVVGRHHAEYLQQQLDRGGLLLWVFLRDAEHERRAKEILAKHSAHDVHVHEYEAASA